MSVPVDKRKESGPEFLYNARQLHIHTIRKCTGLPKKYTFYIGQPLALCAARIHENVKSANSIYPTKQHEAQLRREYFLKAYADLQCMVSYIELVAEIVPIDAKAMKFWTGMVEKEIALVKGVMSKDKEKYKDLP